MLIIIVFDSVLTRSFPDSLQDFYCSLLRDQSRDVTRCLGVCFSLVCFISSMHLHSGYYYYDYVVIGVPNPSWFTEIHS